MSLCQSYNVINDSGDLTYSTAPAIFDATIVATKVGDDFQFRGLVAGLGIAISQDDTTIRIEQIDIPPFSGFSLRLPTNILSNQPLIFDAISAFDFNAGGFYNGGLINVFITNRYFISWIINYLAPEMHIGLENVTTGEIVAQSQDTIIFTSPNLPHNTTYSSTMILYAGNQYRLRVLSSVVTTIYANSIFSIISI